MVCLRNISVDTLHKVDTDEGGDDNIIIIVIIIIIIKFSSYNAWVYHLINTGLSQLSRW